KLPPGQGVQGLRPDAKTRNIYAPEYKTLSIRGCIFSRDDGGGSVQMRIGGIAERNLFLWNETALGIGHPEMRQQSTQNTLIKSNVILHDDNFLPYGGFSVGILL
ncbi:MAG: hypothetical protein ACO3UU_16075, partial [Minisyncoccia bacterium]